ncbi:hypothetical protein C9374_001280 [Naegleria lovaniensis]|uniref:Ubiquitin carboxyl-terminal hydrolase n=1 Tax=Naegleria lovaniensis TaxID=51637 RepID=A0AA88KNK8_NAELO|nr:uncharacterized protein C9374_001280 [Naegleria lovaniensis]KAG2387686.1 hypothetical protein C9374_001280 [Naegleria lovaniensis]
MIQTSTLPKSTSRRSYNYVPQCTSSSVRSSSTIKGRESSNSLMYSASTNSFPHSPTSSFSSHSPSYSSRLNLSSNFSPSSNISSPPHVYSKFSHRFGNNDYHALSKQRTGINTTLDKHQQDSSAPSNYTILSNGSLKRRPSSSLVSKRNTDMFGTYYTFSDEKTPKFISPSSRKDLNRSLDVSFERERSKSQPRSLRKQTSSPSPNLQSPSAKEHGSSIKNLMTNLFGKRGQKFVEVQPQSSNVSSLSLSSVQPNSDEKSKVVPEDEETVTTIMSEHVSSPLEGSSLECNECSSEDMPPIPTSSYLLGHGFNAGLRNIGNTCFMNATLQCLCSIQPIRDHFTSPFKVNPKKEGNLAKQFSILLKNLITPSSENDPYFAINPVEFKRTLNQYTSLFRGFEQQDCQEFLRYVLDGLHEDLNRVVEKPKYEELKDIANESVIDKSIRWYNNYIERNNSFITDLFLGQLKSEIQCHACKRQSITFDPFLDISLPIDFKNPHRRGSSGHYSWPPISKQHHDMNHEVSLEECLSKFTEEEMLTGIEQVYCSACKAHQDVTKKLTFCRIPEVLVVQLKRFSNDEKLLTPVRLSDPINFSNFLAKEARERFYQNEPIEYQLLGVIKHYGSLRGGHYTCQVKNSNEEWYDYNDSTVKKLSHFNPSDSSAYVLFYGRIKYSD